MNTPRPTILICTLSVHPRASKKNAARVEPARLNRQETGNPDRPAGYGPKITADHVVVFAGGQVALQTAAFAFLAPTGGEPPEATPHSIVFVPGYQSCVEAPLQAGSSVTYIPRDPANGWQIDLQKVRAAIQPGVTQFLLLNEPYNPAGTLMTKENQLELVRIARQHNITILCDEVYRLLEHNPATDRLPAMAELYEKGLSAVSISKPWGGCGICIGWLAFQDASSRQRLLDTMYFGTACPSRASELQAIITLRSSNMIVNDRNMPIIRHNLAVLKDVVEVRYPDLLEWVPPTAGAIAFIKFKGPLTSQELGNQLGRNGISIKPAYCFTDNELDVGDSGLDISSYFRVGYGESIMPDALDKFVAFFEEHKEAWRATIRQNA